METITISEKKTVEVNLPLYRKDYCHAYAVISSECCISVCHGVYSNKHIVQSHAGLAWNSTDTEDCTEAEFMEIYHKVKADLDAMVILEPVAE